VTAPAHWGSTRPSEGEVRAWGWVAHLRTGGTTAWSDWSGIGDSRGRYLPGAQQLELLRRLNAAGQPDPVLAESVLTASAAGRGRPDLELVGAGAESRFGPTPVDPSALPPGELVRVAASVLADQVVAAGEPTAAEPPTPRLWRRGYRLVGDPEIADPLRDQLVAKGRPPGGRRQRVVVVGADLGTMAAHAWTHRAFTEGAPVWRDWLALLQDRHEVPGRVDLLAMARKWERRLGREAVHVVLDPAAVAGLVGDRRLTWPATLPGEAGELARRVGSVLGLLVLPETRSVLLSTRLRPRVAAVAAAVRDTGPLVVPVERREWLERAAEKMRRGIKSAGYAVHGDLDDLVPRWAAAPDLPEETAGPSPDATLDLAVRVLLDGTPETEVER
jgi:hypothetical protein